jgi:hypothetical protein
MKAFRTSTAAETRKTMMNLGATSAGNRSLHGLAATAAVAVIGVLLAGYAPASLARQPAALTFSTPDAATAALYVAVQRKDEAQIAAILGSDRRLVSSSDKRQDRLDRERFVEKYRQMHRVAQEPDASAVLYIGAENWPFPIPLVSSSGAWHFDASAGSEEMLFRRIGENELSAAQACRALILARHERQWPERDPSMRALGRLPASASTSGPGVAFHGYIFRSLESDAPTTKNGAGPAFVAYPASYGSTGVMTYLVDQDDVVYAKDLGPRTSQLAKRMRQFQRDPSWQPED